MTDLQPVSVEHDGRIFSGVGVSEASLTETMSRGKTEPDTPETPAQTEPAAAATEAETTAPAGRDPQTGQFTKPTRGQKRFDQLTGEREAERRRADAAEQRARELETRTHSYESRLAQLEQRLQSQASSQAPTPQQVQQAQQPTPADQAKGRPKLGDFTTWEDWEAADATWLEQQIASARTSQEDIDARIRQSIEADRASRTRAERIDAVHASGRQMYPDFDAVFRSSSALQINMPTFYVESILEHPHAEHLIYAFAKDPSKLQALAQLDPVRFGMALAQVVPTTAAASPASTAPPVSSAPAPYQPVGSGSKTTAPSLDDLANSGDDYDKSGYRERRSKELGRRR